MVEQVLPVPTVEHEVFPNPPLKVMLGQVRFPTVLRIADPSSLATFQEAVQDKFRTFRQEHQLNLALGPQGAQAVSAQQAFRFTTQDGAWSLLLTPDALTVEADVAVRYTSYDEFTERFALAWGAILDHYSPNLIVRQGLRYVDHLEGDWPAPDWARLINVDLLGPLVERFGSNITQSASELRLSRPEGVLVFKHGILPLGPNGKMGYLLDFDYFTEDPSDDCSLEAVLRRFDVYHVTIYNFFRWCVTDTALEGFRAHV